MKAILLTDEQYETLTSELHSLYGYHWNGNIHAKDCGSNVVEVIEDPNNQIEISREEFERVQNNA